MRKTQADVYAAIRHRVASGMQLQRRDVVVHIDGVETTVARWIKVYPAVPIKQRQTTKCSNTGLDGRVNRKVNRV